MNDTSIEADLAGRYLADQLSVVERRHFEQRMIEDPGVMRDLEAAATLKLGLVQLERTGRLTSVVGSGPANWTRLLLAVAASMVVGMVLFRVPHEPGASRDASLLGSLFEWNEHGHAMAASPSLLMGEREAPPGVVVSYSLYRTRAAAPDTVFTLPLVRQAIEFRILPDETSPDGDYSVALRASGTPKGQGGVHVQRLRAAADGFVSVFVDSSYFVASDYELTISGTKVGYHTGTTTFTLRVNAP